VAGRATESLAEAKAAGEAPALFVVDEFQVHSLGIVWAAGKAEVLGWLFLWDLRGHGGDFSSWFIFCPFFA
jgi:hypothetical protein